MGKTPSALVLLAFVLPVALFAQTGAPSGPPTPDSDGVYQIGAGITPPELTKPVAPESPLNVDSPQPRHFRFAIVVGVDGAVKLRAVRPNDGSSYLDSAIGAVKTSTFLPGKLNGVPVPVEVCLDASFSPFRPPSTVMMDCDQGGFGSAAFSPNNDPFGLPPGARHPVVIHSVEAEFSDEARRERIEGVVLVTTIVDEQGMPTQIHVVRSAGHGLDENAVAAVSQYRFRPATLDGKPIATRITIEISFRLRR